MNDILPAALLLKRDVRPLLEHALHRVGVVMQENQVGKEVVLQFL
jgi:hypothetical protein